MFYSYSSDSRGAVLITFEEMLSLIEAYYSLLLLDILSTGVETVYLASSSLFFYSSKLDLLLLLLFLILFVYKLSLLMLFFSLWDLRDSWLIDFLTFLGFVMGYSEAEDSDPTLVSWPRFPLSSESEPISSS